MRTTAQSCMQAIPCVLPPRNSHVLNQPFPATKSQTRHRPMLAPQVIFQHYARDLDTVQGIYEANKHKPPVPRNAPPIVSNRAWLRAHSIAC